MDGVAVCALDTAAVVIHVKVWAHLGARESLVAEVADNEARITALETP
jgi:hypothetical protein